MPPTAVQPEGEGKFGAERGKCLVGTCPAALLGRVRHQLFGGGFLFPSLSEGELVFGEKLVPSGRNEPASLSHPTARAPHLQC